MLNNIKNNIGDFFGTSGFSREQRVFKEASIDYPLNRKQYNHFLLKTDDPKFFYTVYEQSKKDLTEKAQEVSLQIEALPPIEKLNRKNKGGIFRSVIGETIKATSDQIKDFNNNMRVCAEQIDSVFPVAEEITLPFTPYKGCPRDVSFKINYQPRPFIT